MPPSSELLQRSVPRNSRGFHNDFFLPNTEFRLAATLEMAPLLYEPTVALLRGTPRSSTHSWRSSLAITALWASIVDWMYIDERRGDRSFILYIALEDQMAENGAIRFLPRSHRLHGPLCGTRLIWPWLMNRNVIRDRQLELPLRAGEAAVWDNSLIHSSGPNSSGELRLAVGVWFRPVEVGLAHLTVTAIITLFATGLTQCSSPARHRSPCWSEHRHGPSLSGSLWCMWIPRRRRWRASRPPAADPTRLGG